ncbi:MAG: hypothetical protein AVDCRST_MAG59-3448, partial [uncultured Thermomicrobiales bacterium]
EMPQIGGLRAVQGHPPRGLLVGGADRRRPPERRGALGPGSTAAPMAGSVPPPAPAHRLLVGYLARKRGTRRHRRCRRRDDRPAELRSAGGGTGRRHRCDAAPGPLL